MSQRIRTGAALATTPLPGGHAPLQFVVRYTTPNTVSNPAWARARCHLPAPTAR